MATAPAAPSSFAATLAQLSDSVIPEAKAHWNDRIVAFSQYMHDFDTGKLVDAIDKFTSQS